MTESAEFHLVNRLGLHARAAAQLVQTANRFKADVMVAKDDEAARRIRAALAERPPNPKARFVAMQLSRSGLQVTRS